MLFLLFLDWMLLFLRFFGCYWANPWCRELLKGLICPCKRLRWRYFCTDTFVHLWISKTVLYGFRYLTLGMIWWLQMQFFRNRAPLIWVARIEEDTNICPQKQMGYHQHDWGFGTSNDSNGAKAPHPSIARNLLTRWPFIDSFRESLRWNLLNSPHFTKA
jgi:hypothetical protein